MTKFCEGLGNWKKAEELCGSLDYYGRYSVEVIEVTGNAGANKVRIAIGFPDGSLHKFKDVPWGSVKDMWVYCPSTYPVAEKEDPVDQSMEVPPKDAGDLYIHGEFIDTLSEESVVPATTKFDPDPATLPEPFKSVVLLEKPPNKYPRSLFAGYIEGSVLATSLTVDGIDSAGTVRSDVLWRKGTGGSADPFDLDISSARISYKVAGDEAVTVFPFAIWLEGIGNDEDGRSGRINLLHALYADRNQVIRVQSEMRLQLFYCGLWSFNLTSAYLRFARALAARLRAGERDIEVYAWLAATVIELVRWSRPVPEKRKSLEELLTELADAGLGFPVRIAALGDDKRRR